MVGEDCSSMYRNAQSCVRINSTFSDSFHVKVGVHQGTLLNPLLFICVLESFEQVVQKRCFMLMT